MLERAGARPQSGGSPQARPLNRLDDRRRCAIGCGPCSLPAAWIPWGGSAWWPALSANAMLRIHGDRDSLLAALTAHWADQQLQIPQTLRPVVGPIPRRPGSKR